ncbi:MAG: D-alanyl-D-alanine carboxypeptidase family protein [Acidobacteriota bacterium]|nr:D-alanyl-D-alanine carboxypeptidase family protein [Acidobacteriota bacterium]
MILKTKTKYAPCLQLALFIFTTLTIGATLFSGCVLNDAPPASTANANTQAPSAAAQKPSPTPAMSIVREPAAANPEPSTTPTLNSTPTPDSVATSVETSTPPSTSIARPLLLSGQQPSIEATTSSKFSAAAAQNRALRGDLAWTFGGRAQRGWNIYVPLLCQLVGTEKDADTSDFAIAIARWQNAAGLADSGVLDDGTLMRIIAGWQASRPKDLSNAQPEQLIAAPASDFYDPIRAPELRQVERQTYEAYRRMVAAAVADRSLGLAASRNGNELAAGEMNLKIISAFRSKEYQQQLRRQFPNSGRAALAINSPHFSGRALDVYVGGEPVEAIDANRALQTQTPVYRWLVKNAARFGFHPYFYEPWHWEYRPQ